MNMITAKEAQRLTKTRWQAQLPNLERLILEAIASNRYEIKYVGKLYDTTIDYLKNLGYDVHVGNNEVLIGWKEWIKNNLNV